MDRAASRFEEEREHATPFRIRNHLRVLHDLRATGREFADSQPCSGGARWCIVADHAAIEEVRGLGLGRELLSVRDFGVSNKRPPSLALALQLLVAWAGEGKRIHLGWDGGVRAWSTSAAARIFSSA